VVAAGLLAAALCLSAAALGAKEPKASKEMLAWAEGPVGWLLLPSEWRELRRVEESAGAVNFIEGFWRLRDPDPGSSGNAFRAQFSARVEAADQLYAEGPLRGSLTARGRALILLGPPPQMRLVSEEVLTPRPGRGKQRSAMRLIRVEIWHYPEADLPRKLVGVLRAADREPSVELKFRLGRRSVELAEGANSLILAARLALVQD